MEAHPRTILVVDEDEEIRSVMIDELSSAGHEVLACTSARQALEQVAIRDDDDEDSRVDLVIADCDMPGMNGLQLAAEIKRRWLSLPVFLMADHDKENFERAANELETLFFEKPINFEWLIRGIQRHVRSRVRE